MSFDQGPLAAVSYRHEDDRWTVVFVRPFAHPPERVWAALTEPGQVSAWAPFVTDYDLSRPGDEPPRLLEYTWGDDVLRWELAPTERGTELTLRHTVGGADMMPKVAAGWHLCLRVAERLLDGDPIPPIRGQEAMDYGWQALNDAYDEALGAPR
jgi:uncharacterized protein YndB with AHSA1/START domain